MKTVVNFLSTVGFVILTGLVAVTGNAVASTPDGETPANEGVCDVLKVDGITKGLYGLCVAYCEAQDLNDMNKEPPSTKILANYNRKKQAEDPGMPCLAPPPNCPCWTPEELDAIFADGISAPILGLPFGMCDFSSNQAAFLDLTTAYQVAQGTIDGGGSTCAFTDARPEVGKSVFFKITEDDAVICKAQVENKCATYSVPTAP
jgi:hypothetical protein